MVIINGKIFTMEKMTGIIEKGYVRINGKRIEDIGDMSSFLWKSGEISPKVTVTAQSIPKDTQVPPGTTITLEFTDTTARD